MLFRSKFFPQTVDPKLRREAKMRMTVLLSLEKYIGGKESIINKMMLYMFYNVLKVYKY